MTPQERRADGLTIRFAESGAGGDETILLLSSCPESLFAWNTIWPRMWEDGAADYLRLTSAWIHVRRITRSGG